ncbi:MAG TPA: LuxR C-terminal-related transcriptional regulator [Gemmatimonadales bacterium]|nr:LuxR C-terminal-related transcriptional regulator [Gemmatimonadales bacterium]
MGAPPSFADPLTAGQEALQRARWEEARAAFESALERKRSPEALEGLATAHWWLDEIPRSLELREEAYRRYREGGDPRGAARVAIMIALDCLEYRGEPAVAQGWYQRAEALLSGLGSTEEHGWLAVGRAQLALFIDHDPEAARRYAAEVATAARGAGSLDLEILARAIDGLALVIIGQVTEGMRLLDEAATAATAGEMHDYLAIAASCCVMIAACEMTRDIDRAAQWCDKTLDFCQSLRIGSLLASCRVQHAGVLTWQGAWAAAEGELRAAIRTLEQVRPGLRGDGIVRLADLRRRQGRFEEAEILLNELETSVLAQYVRAALALDNGDAEAAVDLAERYLRRLKPESKTERLKAVELLVLGCTSLGQWDRAREWLEELRGAVQAVGTEPVQASLAYAEGALAAAVGDRETAKHRFEDAVDLFARSGTPFEAARARLELAQQLAVLGRRGAATREARGARDRFADLGAARELKRAEAVLSQLQAGPPSERQPSKAPAGRLTRRELDVLRLVAGGLSNGEIASRLSLSEFTVKRHVQNILRKLDLPSRAGAAAYAAKHQLV